MSTPFFIWERLVAPPGWSRSLVHPAALSIHLWVGTTYSWSVFGSRWKERWTSPARSAPCRSPSVSSCRAFGGDLGTWVTARAARGDVRRDVLLLRGLAGRLRRLAMRQYWLVLFGYGRARWYRLGIGYISPVSTLIKWFPDSQAWQRGWRSWASAVARSSRRRGRAACFDLFGPTLGHLEDLPCRGAGLRGVHVDGMAVDPGAAPGGRRATGNPRRRGPARRHGRSGLGQQRGQDTPVLAALGGAVLQRDCGHRNPEKAAPIYQDFFPTPAAGPPCWPRRPRGSWQCCRWRTCWAA